MNNSSFPRVDVCVVTYNQASLIEACIQSILDQDYPNFRIIISDDCSQDATPNILQRLAALHPDKIQLHINPNNLGITGNCRQALNLAQSDYVILFGGDDLMRKDRLSKQVRHLQNHPRSAGCMSDVAVEDVFSGEIRIAHFPDFASENFLKILTTYTQAPSSSLMLNRKVCRDLQYDARIPVVSDWLLVNEVAAIGMVYISEPLMTYRRHASNTTLRGADKTYIDDRLVAIDILFSKLQDHYWKFRLARSNVYLSVAIRNWHANKKRHSIKFLLYAFLEYALNKTIYLMLLKLIQNPFRKRF